ncbi:AAA family ATPase [Candidatus Woesearchaeota archaeon]|nr:hypothetical protein [uncultured archaeon]MBS3142066.1 AAA family ATPase [Candidatus Woesearchaeota archaeon]
MKRIVISGGSYSGKSSLVKLFKRDKYKVIPDVGFEVIKSLNKRLGIQGQKRFRHNNPLAFYSMILKKQVQLEKHIKEKRVILDRGVYDYLAMFQLKNQKIPKMLTILVKNTVYDTVFLCDTLSNFDQRKATGRSLSKKDSQRLKGLIRKIYTQAGIKVIHVREMPLKQRYIFIKKHI